LVALALAFSVLSYRGGVSPPAAAGARAAPVVVTYAAEQASLTIFYIVDDPDKEVAVKLTEQDITFAYLESQRPNPRTFCVLQASTPEQAARAEDLTSLAAQELNAAGAAFAIVDLRGPAD
jgi:hypothetical protein